MIWPSDQEAVNSLLPGRPVPARWQPPNVPFGRTSPSKMLLVRLSLARLAGNREAPTHDTTEDDAGGGESATIRSTQTSAQAGKATEATLSQHCPSQRRVGIG